MKTLYININGDEIQSSENIVVVGTPDDAIVDKFYYELGKEIVKGIDAPGIRGLVKHIVKSYKDIDENAFDTITKQWLRVKDKLLGENPTGSETIKLPMEYVKWLQNYGDTDHTEIAKSLYARNRLVEICLDKIYRNSVNIIINSIEPDNYGQFVVNDEVVTDDSAISIAIMKKFDGIAFKPYKKEDVSPNCEMNPCECPKACPKCGKEPCVCNSVKEWSTAEDLKNGLIILDGITLNKTTIKELRAKGFKCERDKNNQFIFYAEINNYLSVYIPQCRYKDIDEIKNEFKLSGPDDIDAEFFINEGKVVKTMMLEITSDCLEQGSCPFFKELGIIDNVDDFDYDDFIEMLEDLGYTKVEDPYGDDDADDFFVNNVQNTNNWILVGLKWSWDNDDNFTITIGFDVCFLNELISYKTGEVLKRGVHRRANRKDDY